MSGSKKRRGKAKTVPTPPKETMVFHSSNRIGKAGERFVETFVEEQLKLAYRRIDAPDIGVDGEIETLGEGGVARGGFLKVQVKTIEASPRAKRFKVPFDEAHMNYYDSLIVPPILAVVSLADQAIWWKPILHKENYRTRRGGFAIPIDTALNRMTVASATLLGMIAERSNAMIARYLVEDIEEELDEIDAEEAGANYDLVTVQGWVQTLQSIEARMREVRVLLKWERRYTDDITRTEQRQRLINDRIAARKEWLAEQNCEDLLEQRYWGGED